MGTLGTIETARKARQSDGTSWVKRFKEYVKREEVEASPQNLRDWDKKHNASAIRRAWGTDKEILDRAITDRYREELYNHFWVPRRGEDGKAMPGLSGVRSIEGEHVLLENLTEAQSEYVADTIHRRIHNDSIRLNSVFKQWKRVKREVLEDVEAAEMGLPADWRRKKGQTF